MANFEKPASKYVVRLSVGERERLEEILASRTKSKETRKRAWVLLKADEGELGPAWTDEKIAEAYDCSTRMVQNLRKRLVLEGFEAVLQRKRQSDPARLKIDGEAEARLIALAQSPPPKGRARWTVRLLTAKAIELAIIPETSHYTVWSRLKKTNCDLT